MINERLLFHYLRNINYLQDDQNAIGATTSTTLRNTTACDDTDCKYVRKFGADYLIKDVTDIEDPVDVNMIFRVYAEDGTLLGSRTGGGAFVDGAAVDPAQPCYMEIEASGGNVDVLATITIDTDIDAGGKTFVCAAETITDGDTLTLYLSETTSTYYDSAYKYGGARHTPDGTEALPYFHPEVADAALGGAFTNVTVLDSATYEVENYAISLAATIWQSASGQAAKLTNGVGARVTREVEHDGNNTDTRYVSKAGNDGNPGTYQEPYLTIQFAENNMGGLAYLNIMDGGTYEENVVISGNLTLESTYESIPTVKGIANEGDVIEITSAIVIIAGVKIDGNSISLNGININVAGFVGTITNNDFTDIKYKLSITLNAGIGMEDKAGYDGDIIGNHFYDGFSNYGINIHTDDAIVGGNIQKNSIHDWGLGANGVAIDVFSAVLVPAGTTISNNLAYKMGGHGMSVTSTSTINATIENNTLVSNGRDGLYVVALVAFGGIVRDTITYFNGDFDLESAAGVAITITESNYGTNSGFTIGGGCITSDPRFCKDTAPYQWGLSANSEALRADTSSDDMGAHFRMIEINASNVEINGFNIDGQSQYNNALYIADAVNHTGTLIYWNSIYDFQGIEIDLYDDNTNTAAEIKNNKIYNGGNGIKLSYGGNTVEENLIYNQSVYGVFVERSGDIFNHNSFYNNYYAMYCESTSGGINIKNCIFHGNAWRDISSEVNIKVTYCCITGGVDNVDITDDSNTTDEPLFENVVFGSENFHVKTKFGGYIHDSPCINASDDDPVKDIGAYDVVRSVTAESRQKYQLASNPRDMDPFLRIKSEININNAVGILKRYGLATKRVFPLRYADNDYQTQEQIETLQDIALLIPGVDGLKETDCEILLHILPDQKLFIGTGGTISATAKTIDDAFQTWNRNAFKGFWAAVTFTSGVDLVIDAAAKTGTKAGAGWTVNEWTGYYFYHNYDYYRILSNTATILTFSDPNGTLVNETAATYSIEKYFKILSNSKNQLLLEDTDNELVTGPYDYYIDFIKVQSINKNVSPKQDGYYYQKYFSKTGFPITFEEK